MWSVESFVETCIDIRRIRIWRIIRICYQVFEYDLDIHNNNSAADGGGTVIL